MQANIQIPKIPDNPLPRHEEPKYLDKQTMLLHEALIMLRFLKDRSAIEKITIADTMDDYYLLTLKFKESKPKREGWLKSFLSEKYSSFLWRTDIDIFNTADFDEFLAFKLLNHDEFIILKTLAIHEGLIF